MMDMSDDGSLQSSSDTDSTVSTNFTESNLPGAGRLLGKLYSSAGKKLEKAMARFVNRAGYGPEATYAKLLDLYRDQRDITDAEAKSMLVAYITYGTNSYISLRFTKALPKTH